MAGRTDKRGVLDEAIFSYSVTKGGKVFLYWRGKPVVTLAGRQAERFIAAVAAVGGKEAQLLMAKATGHFKHGNEKTDQRGNGA